MSLLACGLTPATVASLASREASLPPAVSFPEIKPAEAGDRGMAEPPHVGNCEPGLAQPGGLILPPANPASEWSCTGLYRGDDHLIDVVACPQCFGTDDDCGRCAGAGKVVVL